MPDAAHLHALLQQGLALQQAGRLEDARAAYAQVLKTDPRNFDALHLLGVIAAQTKDFAESVKLISRALTVDPNNATAHYNRGIALDELRLCEAAIAAYDKAIALKPDHVVAYNNRGVALHNLRHLTDAVASFDQAIALAPGYAEAHHNRGHALSELGRLEDALAAFDEALRLRPDYPFLAGTRLHTKMRLCDWRGVDADVAALESDIARGAPVTVAWPILGLSNDAALQHKAVALWANATHPANPALGPLPPAKRHGKIRVGYFSMDFREHPVAQLTARLFELHDKKNFEIIAFSYGPDTRDDMQRRLRGAFNTFIDVREKSDPDIAALARKMNIDIAVDLAGYTTAARPGIMAARAAPVQVNFLGYAGTMAVPYIDYVLADAHALPDALRPYFSERVATLPWFMPTDNTRAVSERTFTRAEMGLPLQGFVFCCFNAAQKILPATFAIWMRLLQRIDGSVLWLPDLGATATGHLRREAEQRGVNPQRLIFGPRMPSLADHLARQRLADLFLDTLPFNAHTTAIDALWAGLPVLTCAGGSFAGRVAASALYAAGLPELVTTAPEAYEALAVALATESGRLLALKDRLAATRATMPLFDSARFTRYVEDAYGRMHARAQAGLPPDHITIEHHG